MRHRPVRDVAADLGGPNQSIPRTVSDAFAIARSIACVTPSVEDPVDSMDLLDVIADGGLLWDRRDMALFPSRPGYPRVVAFADPSW